MKSTKKLIDYVIRAFPFSKLEIARIESAVKYDFTKLIA